ncbi:YcxB family protein [Goodfellowiella coeruleoviolacea]|uniref:YcxB-like protein n=1 Tax=Goodfellowiella coeruleoviolacea TaxID=334858 RepID=A0AAE3GDK8_9PSEU|nr:YcxB family protein [Goodfellowiella coeruleoviolacea]MCP2166261.1 YcxB-like protein [Goodfellowiella coeruleoviolacea]
MYVTTTYQPDRKEISRGVRRTLRPARVLVWSACGLLVVLTALSVALFERYQVVVVCLAVAVAGAVALELVPGLVIRRMAARFIRPTHVLITEHSYRVETDLDKAEYNWRGFHKVEETPEFFVLHQTRRTIATLPKRAFHPAQVAELSAFFRQLPTATNPARPVA